MRMLKYLFAIPVAVIGMVAARDAVADTCDPAIGAGTLVAGVCRYTSCLLSNNSTHDYLGDGQCYCHKTTQQFGSAFIKIFQIRTSKTVC